MKRGRDHQWNGRAIDAMLCFRHARQVESRCIRRTPFHLGEVLWQLGKVPDAIAAWRDAICGQRQSPRAELSRWQGHSLAAGDLAGSAAAAPRRPPDRSDNARAAIIEALARILQGTSTATTWWRCRTLEREPRLLEVRGDLRSLCLSRSTASRSSGVATRSSRALGRVPAPLASAHPLLLAHAIEAAADARVDAGVLPSFRRWRANEHIDATNMTLVRRVAAAAARNDPVAGAGARRALRRADVRRRVRARHASWLADSQRWPASARRRAVPAADIAPPRRAARSRDRPRCRAMRSTSPSRRWAGHPSEVMNVARTVAPAVVELPIHRRFGWQGAGRARLRRAGRDLAGYCRSAASRAAPARAIYALGTIAGPSLPSLVAIVRFRRRRLLIGALVALHAAHDAGRDCALDAAALDALWSDAVRAHQRGDGESARAAYSRACSTCNQASPPGTICAESSLATRRPRGCTCRLLRGARGGAGYVDARIAARRRCDDRARDRGWPLRCARRRASASGERRACGGRSASPSSPCAAAHAPPPSFERAFALDPADGDTHYNHGVALQMRRSFTGCGARLSARAGVRAVAGRRPTSTSASCFSEQGTSDAAIAGLRDRARARSDGTCPRTRIWAKSLLRARAVSTRGCANFEPLRGELSGCAAARRCRRSKSASTAATSPALDRYLDGLRQERVRAAERDRSSSTASKQLLYLLLYFDVEPEMLLEFRADVRRGRATRLRRAAAASGGARGRAGCASAISPATCAIT